MRPVPSTPGVVTSYTDGVLVNNNDTDQSYMADAQLQQEMDGGTVNSSRDVTGGYAESLTIHRANTSSSAA
ncbi:hypothetical protein DFQ14_111163 [Halopolyspora algeriensis]|uniref:Uncharacterized protein n=1 Tax=Halopolyspora algeriensis TaxID=1500506 RepID=A0A368VHC4_9ACTN|nr:hypothetical protein DFQ14_111163 [Halopolyspora algeriensis]TQM53796.1 hypothetical protein FHU43_1963 [Halopolyspora algeriensis]